jgi:hypothetical protein
MLYHDRSRQKRVREATQKLWYDLCDADGLTLAERRLLKRAAREMGLATPALLFFRPTAFAAYVKDRNRRLPEDRREQLTRIARMLFADRPPESLADTGAVGDDGLPRRFAPDELRELAN